MAFGGLLSKINMQQPTKNRQPWWRVLLRGGRTSATHGGSAITSFLEGVEVN
jgi:alkylated DNA nucleotide flippase Atl1